MDIAPVLRGARRRAGLTLRALAESAGTSHATLAAYEAGTKVPRLDTLVRILDAAGLEVRLDLTPRPDAGGAARRAKGDELVEVLRLAEQFPARHAEVLEAPPFGTAA